MTHTPGPWTADGELIKRDCPALGNTNVKIAKVSQRNLNTDGNAHLIAAAPELLAACKAIDDCHFPDDNFGAVADALKLIRTAIAKAEGESK